mgnify:FL=1
MAFVGDGAAAAYINFNGTNNSIRESRRVSSIQDMGNESYRINLSSALPNTNFQWAGAGGRAGGDANSWTGEDITDRTTSRIRCNWYDNGATRRTPTHAMCIFTCNDFS